jgi:hypothetical protein
MIMLELRVHLFLPLKLGKSGKPYVQIGEKISESKPASASHISHCETNCSLIDELVHCQKPDQ